MLFQRNTKLYIYLRSDWVKKLLAQLVLDIYFPQQIVEGDWVHNIPAYFIIIMRLHTSLLHGKLSLNHWHCLLREVTLSISKGASIWLSILKSLMSLHYLSAGVLLFASTACAFTPAAAQLKHSCANTPKPHS